MGRPFGIWNHLLTEYSSRFPLSCTVIPTPYQDKRYLEVMIRIVIVQFDLIISTMH